MKIPVPAEFNFEMNVEFLDRSPLELLHTHAGGRIWKALVAGDEKILITVRPGSAHLRVEFPAGEPSGQGKEYVRKYITEWFDLETDLKPFYQLASADPLLKGLVTKYFGYRIIGQPDLYESLVWAVLGQQINLKFAYTLKHRFVGKFGERLHFGNGSYFMFPRAALIAKIDPQQLLDLQFSRQKAAYTINIAEAFASGRISKEQLQGLSLQGAKEILMQIKGVGNWTANYALMKTFRYPDAFPLEDAGLHNAIRNLKKMKTKPTLDQVKRIFRKYRGWEAYATLYLWKSLT